MAGPNFFIQNVHFFCSHRTIVIPNQILSSPVFCPWVSWFLKKQALENFVLKKQATLPPQ